MDLSLITPSGQNIDGTCQLVGVINGTESVLFTFAQTTGGLKKLITNSGSGINDYTITFKGTNYAVNDQFSVDGGNVLALGEIAGVDIFGSATSIVITFIGNGYFISDSVNTTTVTGIGSGLRISINKVKETDVLQDDFFLNDITEISVNTKSLIRGADFIQYISTGIIRCTNPQFNDGTILIAKV